MRDFTIAQSSWQKLRHIYKQRLYNMLVDPSASMFLRPTDSISVRPTVLGYHEDCLEALIRDLAGDYGDFFLDIGANIGLSSIMVGKQFCRIDCVEPNPLMVNILRTNIMISDLGQRTHIHDVALGQVDGRSELLVPSLNFGAGYIAQNNPSDKPDADERLRNTGEVSTQIIDVRDARAWLHTLFAEYLVDDYSAGVIKINVEGYEPIILAALFEMMPTSIRAVVLLENFMPIFDTDRFNSEVHDLSWHYLAKIRRPFASIPFKLLGLSSAYRHELRPLTPDTHQPHDVVVFLD